MTGTTLEHGGGGQPLAPAAARFAATMLRQSPQTRRTYQSVYGRFAAWLADRTGQPDPPVSAFTADALAAYLDHLETDRSPGTVKKERAALNRLAKYLHHTGALNATDILLVETRQPRGSDGAREALDEQTWQRVKALARARLTPDPRARASRVAATRDAAIVLLLGDVGLRSDELRSLRTDSVFLRRRDASRPWLRIDGKGARRRVVPLPTAALDALQRWERVRPPELDHDPLLFPRLGRQRMDGSFPDAGGKLSDRALAEIVRPILLAAGVPEDLAHPHALRHTYGSLFMRRGGDLRTLQELMGHESLASTGIYVHPSADTLEAAVDAHEHGASALERHVERRRRRQR